jgi:hypothetical protein
MVGHEFPSKEKLNHVYSRRINWRIILYYVKDHVYSTSNNLDICKTSLMVSTLFVQINF